MSIIVQKYGGSILQNFKDLQKVADNIISTIKRGNSVVAVVSALKGETDKLINYAYEVNKRPDARELDMLISTGEQKTGALLALILQGKNISAISFTGHQIGIITDSEYGNANILKINSEILKNEINLGKVIIIAGFQGINQLEEITTLGRGGSDLTAVALGVTLKADLVEFYKDIGQLYTNNPKLGNGKPIKKIDYGSLLELSKGNLKILSSKAVETAKKYNLTILIRSLKNNKKTLIVNENFTFQDEKYLAMTKKENEYQILIKNILKPKLLKLLKGNFNVNYLDRINFDKKQNFLLTFNKENSKKMESILKRDKMDYEIKGPFNRIIISGWGYSSFDKFYRKIYSILNLKNMDFYDVHFSHYSVSLLMRSTYEKTLIEAIDRINNG
ncbi:hypothetical protein J7L48_05300 [bacterium]|nr:hypothetical protein [bacterium]